MSFCLCLSLSLSFCRYVSASLSLPLCRNVFLPLSVTLLLCLSASLSFCLCRYVFLSLLLSVTLPLSLCLRFSLSFIHIVSQHYGQCYWITLFASVCVSYCIFHVRAALVLSSLPQLGGYVSVLMSQRQCDRLGSHSQQTIRIRLLRDYVINKKIN